jgi:hypothetical protein
MTFRLPTLEVPNQFVAIFVGTRSLDEFDAGGPEPHLHVDIYRTQQTRDEFIEAWREHFEGKTLLAMTDDPGYVGDRRVFGHQVDIQLLLRRMGCDLRFRVTGFVYGGAKVPDLPTSKGANLLPESRQRYRPDPERAWDAVLAMCDPMYGRSKP